VGLVATVGAVGVGGTGRLVCFGAAMMRTAEVGASFKVVGAIFALPPVSVLLFLLAPKVLLWWALLGP
jgi:hypothetical protein